MSAAGSTSRNPAAPAVVAALALALISAASAGSPAALPVRAGDARSTFAEVETSRLLAAAVQAAKNLLGVDAPAHAIIHAEPRVAIRSIASPLGWPAAAMVRRPVSGALEPHLTDLPPPIC
jgi:hypothetical protein